jgi:ribosomal protein L9
MDINDNDMHNYILYDNLDAFPLSEKTIKSLEMALSDLEKTRIEKLKQKEALLEKINALWLKLDIPEADKSSFKKSFSQFQEIEIVSNKIFSFLESEVERLELLKRNNIKRVIEKMRLEIQELWSSLRYCEEQKKEFPQFKENEELNGIMI